MSALLATEIKGSGAADLTAWLVHNRPKLNVKAFDDALTNVNVLTDVYAMPLEKMGLSTNLSSLLVPSDADSGEASLKAVGAQYTCLTCRLTFAEHVQQQEHFKSDWHIVNIKRKMKGEQPLSEEDFGRTHNATSTAGNDESDNDDTQEPADGTVSSDESNDSENEEPATSMDLDDHGNDAEDTLRTEYVDERGSIRKEYSHTSGPQFVVELTSMAPYRYRFSTAILRADSPLTKRDWSYTPHLWSYFHQSLGYIRSKPFMAVLVLRSGRFAGAIFNNQNARNPLLTHKVIRRYTVRAKAGGGQSSHDNKHGKAKSMGAQLRRYGEQMLQEDIERLLTAWVDYLSQCGVILIAATKTMRGNLFDKDDNVATSATSTTAATAAAASAKKVQLLQKNDPRVVFVPFAVDKPTLETAKLIRDRALAVQITTAAASTTSVSATTETADGTVNNVPVSVVAAPKVSAADDEEDAESLLLSNTHSRRLVAACATDSDDAAVAIIREVVQELGIDVSSGPANTAPIQSEDRGSDSDNDNDNDGDDNVDALARDVKDQLTISRQASSASVDDLEAILRLPNTLADLSTPLHMASERNLLRTVRLLMQLGADPERLDARGRTAYFLAKTKEMREMFRRVRGLLGEHRWQWNKTGIPGAITEEKIAQQKLKEKEKKKRAQQRKKEQKTKAEQQAKDAEVARQLQAEFQRDEKIRREAQQRQAAGTCAMCKKSLYGQDFYDVCEQRCCSTNCVQQLRRKLAADAALARFSKK